MTLPEFLPYITGGGGALVALTVAAWLFLTGRLVPKPFHDATVRDKDKQIGDLSQAVLRERERADAAILAAQTTRDVLQALHRETKI